MTDKSTALDPRALRFGAAVALAATAAGLLAGVGHYQVFYDTNASADEGAANIFLEGLIFLGILLAGLPVATFLSVWRGRANAVTQGLIAILACWVIGFGLGGTVLTVLPGGSTDVFGLFVTLAPVYLLCQVVAVAVAALARRMRRGSED